ncbi:Predicted dehydrogenase [Amphibacillus marinus]|uniref:Predicted dehydrogenase n=1 Tax=Amphibacillus marinus TaxID=872970 RepID=A0A1H8KGH4_9BACI|nr:Gfo/Idh/MocA family oxidoreductase [Amphibacillus marinus]SEN91955.1 Predicted dehydrogenase [Amphibacillus marinus]
MLTIGYIGNGKSTNRYHLPFSTNNNNIRVKTIYSRTLKQGEWAQLSGVTYVDNINELLLDAAIDLIVICTHMDSHFDYAKLALEHGKHVLVEKPFTETADQARALFSLAKEKNLFIQCYQNRRYDSDFLTVQKVIDSGVLGDLLEVEMHFDYFRPEVPEGITSFSIETSYLYGHGCHTIDQVLAYFGMPDQVSFDVRQLLGVGRMNDYFDLDFFYDNLKISVKSSYFRIKPRPSFAVYGKKGSFVKETKDRQEEHLKLFYLPEHEDFGIDLPEHYGTLTYLDDNGNYHEEKVVSVAGDYGQVYEDVYQSIINGADKVTTDKQTIRQIELLEEGLATILNEG